MKNTQAAMLALTKPEVLASVASLHEDGLKPFGRVILKRLRECAALRYAAEQGLPAEAVDAEEMPRLNPRHLRKVCETCKQLRVVPEEGREFSVTLATQSSNSPHFLDVCSPVDPYPEEFWHEFAAYLDMAGKKLHLPGGRYACARTFISNSLPFFLDFSLAQVCHIVQLAINCRRLLGYNREGWLVPYKRSEGWVKEQCASALSSTGQETLPVVSWNEARTLLRQLLQFHHQAHSGGVTLSDLKRMFRITFGRELSETALGHVRLLDLMRDPRMSDVCALHGHGNGQTMVKGISTVLASPCQTIPPGMWTMPMQMCHIPMMSMLPTHAGINASTGGQEALLSPGSSPRGSLCGAFSFATESTAEGSRTSKSEALVSPGSSPRGSLCGAHSFATESTAEGFLERSGEGDTEAECSTPWSVSVKNTFIDVITSEFGLASPTSRQRRRSTPAFCRSPVSQ